MDNKVPQQINDIVGDNVKKLAQLFPSAVKDGEVDFEALKEEIGQYEEVGSEKYELTWAGKKNAKRIAQEDVIGRTLKFIPEDSRDANTTENLYIEGDNLEVLKLLRQNYYGAIKMIYIDPPYNSGKDYIYNDNYVMSEEEAQVVDETRGFNGEKYTVNQKSSNRFHAKWMSMIYSRLLIARQLLTDDGVIFVSIDEKESSNLRILCNEIFDEENFIGELVWESTTQPINSGSARFNLQKKTEPILLYAKNKANIKGFCLKQQESDLVYPHNGKFGKCRFEIIEKSDAGDYSRPTMRFPILGQYPREGKRWQIGRETAEDLERTGRVEIVDGIVKRAVYPEDEIDKVKFLPFWSLLLANKVGTAQNGKDMLNTIMGNSVGFDTVKSVELLKELLSYIGNDYIVLDFFSGSATTAHAVMQLNVDDNGHRKYVLVQYPEVSKEDTDMTKVLMQLGKKPNICELGKERIRRAGDKIKQEHPDADIDIGFKVFRTADTNIKWNSLMDIGQVDMNQLEYTPDLVDFMPDANDVDIVYELMLRQRDVALSESLEQLSDIGSRTYLYASSYLVCLETKITEELVSKLAELDPLPIKFIFRDSAFKDDIALKDETFRRLKALIEKNAGTNKPTYTVEFI